MPSSGKSEAVLIAQNRGYHIARMGDMVWEETKKRGLALTDRNVGRIATEMRKKFGMDIWAKKIIVQLKEKKQLRIVIIDGIRNIEEVLLLKKELSNDFTLVAIHSEDEIRYQRSLARGRIDDSSSIKKVKERDQRELGWGINKVIDSADLAIHNNGELSEFIEKINAFFDSIEKR